MCVTVDLLLFFSPDFFFWSLFCCFNWIKSVWLFLFVFFQNPSTSRTLPGQCLTHTSSSESSTCFIGVLRCWERKGPSLPFWVYPFKNVAMDAAVMPPSLPPLPPPILLCFETDTEISSWWIYVFLLFFNCLSWKLWVYAMIVWLTDPLWCLKDVWTIGLSGPVRNPTLTFSLTHMVGQKERRVGWDGRTN